MVCPFIDLLKLLFDFFITLITFILGYWLSSYQLNKKEIKELNNVYEYFLQYLKKQHKSICRQCDLIEEYKGKIVNLLNTNPPPLTLINQPYYILDSLNREKVARSLKVNGHSIENTMKIIGFIELSRAVFENIIEFHKGFMNRHLDIRNRWNKEIKTFHKQKATMLKRPKDEIKSTLYLIQMNHIYNQWTLEALDLSLSYTIENLAKPIGLLMSAEHQLNPENSDVIDMLEITQTLEIIYEEWKIEISSCESLLRSQIEVLRDVESSINLNEVYN